MLAGAMHIDIVSDVICPWCFIGKRRLERALTAHGDADVSRSWRAFQLNPEMPRGGMPREAYLAAKFGSNANAGRLYGTIAETGAAEGIDFAFERIRRTPSTLQAHRLIRYAARNGGAGPLVEALFLAYFTAGRDVGDRDTLADIAAGAGLDREAAAQYLESGAGEQEVVAEDRAARRLGINAVPCFIVDGGYALSGAQEPEFFFPLFDLARNAATAPAEES
jgi:predicted DsbA family dithiol-disulfide isomerase